jgi:rSAM/selenodomain-associated transferase 2
MDRLPIVSLIIPVLNEAENISEIIQHIRELDADGGAEIIVVDGDPEGSTINTITDEGVRTVLSEKSRARQMNRGAALATGDILLFLHADTLLPSHAFALIQAAMNDKGFVGGAFDLGFNTRRRIFKITETYVFLRTRLTKIPFGDQAIFIRHHHFEQLGGYRDIPIMEDVELMRRIRGSGDKIRIFYDRVMTSPRRWEKEGVVYCTLRDWILQVLYFLGISPDKLAKFYKSDYFKQKGV